MAGPVGRKPTAPAVATVGAAGNTSHPYSGGVTVGVVGDPSTPTVE